MNFKKGWQSKVDEEGRLILSPEFRDPLWVETVE